MAARTRSRDGEIYHLGGEDEGAHHAHQRNDVLVPPVGFGAVVARTPDFPDCRSEQGQRYGSRNGEYRRGDQCVGHVHSLLFFRFSDRPVRPLPDRTDGYSVFAPGCCAARCFLFSGYQFEWSGFSSSSNLTSGSRKSHVVMQNGPVRVAIPTGAISIYMPA